MRPHEIGVKMQMAVEAAGLDCDVEEAGSGTVYIRVWDDTTETDARLRVSNHVHLGGGISYYGRDLDIDICTDRRQIHADGHNLTDALRILSHRFGRTLTPVRRKPDRRKVGERSIRDGVVFEIQRNPQGPGKWDVPLFQLSSLLEGADWRTISLREVLEAKK